MATTASLSSSNAPEHVQKHVRLLSATITGNEARVRELLGTEKWTTPADHDTLRQALAKAAIKSGPAIVCLLLDAGADVHPRKEKDVSPLCKAAETGNLAIVKQLLEYKADPNWRQPKSGHTALCSAALRGHTAVVKALLDAGADPDGSRDKADSNKIGASDGRTPLLLLASEKSSKWNLDIVSLLLQKGADPNLRDSTRRSPLHWTVTNGLLDFARCLLSGAYGIKADPNAAQNRGKTALHLASALSNRLDFVALLLEHGAYADATSDGRWTPLINAAEKGHEDVVAKLLAAGANVNAELSNHMTALHWASSNGHEGVVKLLLERPETNLNRKDQFERTPMICAAERRDANIVQLLSPARHAHKLSESAREASKKFEATIVDFGEFQEERYLKDTVKEKKLQLVFKHTVYDLLYGLDEKTGKPTVPVLTKNIKWQPHFRWIHLPANNIAWIETLLAKSFVETGHRDVEGFKALGKCFDQEYRGPLAHAKFMRPYCKRIPNERIEREESSTLGSVREQMIEHTGGLSQIPGTESTTDQSEHNVGKSDTKKKTKSEQISERHPPRQKRNKGHPGNPPGTKEAKLQSRQSSFASSEAFKQLVTHGKMVLYMPFLHYETDDRRQKMTRIIEKAREGQPPSPNASRDELLIHAYMGQHLHPRRTLDQFFYHGIDTSKRDIDQVVYRYCRDYRGSEELKLFMVDQLWMWILGGDTVITCFPQRWDQPKQDPLNMVDGIIEETNAKTRDRIQSVYDLAMVITGRCAGMFDRHRIDEQQYQFLDMFESSIGNVTDKESQLFSKFNKASEKAMAWLKYARRNNDEQYDEKFADDLLNIHSETMLLAEIKDIQDELNIIDEVLRLQSSVLEKLQLNIEQELRIEGSRKITDLILKDIKNRYQEQMRLITERHHDIERMCDQASGITMSLTNLLDLKQKHSNALEARFAREQAIIAAKQGQTIMVFTIVTIIFLPMSFIAAFFAINFEDWGNRLTMSYVSKYMFGIGLAVSFIFVAAAFLVEDISSIWKASLRRFWKLFSRFPGRNSHQQTQKNLQHALHGLSTTSYNEKPGTADGASTAHHSMSEGVEARSRGSHGVNSYVTTAAAGSAAPAARISLERGRYGQPRLGATSPMRYGGRNMSTGRSCERAPWTRTSFDGRRPRFSADLESGRERSRERVRWSPHSEYEE
ncbi:hypothetical protein BD289DRAFT_423157 [Coniella lustricola]|uniref:Uncharacterized protein n=1 Tax=Coniella lustricola TaxID=2025994 RepID=A0A2T3AKG0_9PEZI|nr:hypothetical protein BD289DRAFT_423157 [Coniella lustricola]